MISVSCFPLSELTDINKTLVKILPKHEHDFCENFRVSKAYPQETQHEDMLNYCCLDSPRKPLRPLIGELLKYILGIRT